MRILLIAVVAVPLFLAGSAVVGTLSHSYRPMLGSFGLQRAYIFHGPGGRYGFAEHSSEIAREYGVASVVLIADRQFRLPVRVTTTLAAATALVVLASIGSAVYRRGIIRHENAA